MHFTAFESSLRGIRFQVQPVPPDARARQAAFTSVSLLVSVSAAPDVTPSEVRSPLSVGSLPATAVEPGWRWISWKSPSLTFRPLLPASRGFKSQNLEGEGQRRTKAEVDERHLGASWQVVHDF